MTRILNRLCATISHHVPAAVVYCTEKARVIHEQIGYSARRGMVIENGIDIGKFRSDPLQREPTRRRWGVEADDELLAVIGRFDPQKDYPTALEAFAMVLRRRPSARLALIGPGNDPSNTELVALARQLGVSERVMLLGVVPDIHVAMNGLDLLVISSSYGEALPVVALEAAAMMVPIVTTDIADYGNLGLHSDQIVPASDAAQLAGAIARRLDARWSDMELQRTRTLMDTVGRRFTLETMANRYFQVFSDLASSRQAAGR